MKRNFITFCSFVVTLVLLCNITFASSIKPEMVQYSANSEIQKQFSSINEIKEFVKSKKDVNIVVFDNSGKPVSEVLSDGISIDYEYTDDVLSEIKSSTGHTRKYTYINDDVKIDDFYNEKLIESKTFLKNNQDKASIETSNTSSQQTSSNQTLMAAAATEAYNVKGVYMNNLISDSDFKYQSLTASQIQSFLTTKNSCLKDNIMVYIQASYDSSPVWAGYNINPAQCISQYATQYSINLKLILVTLQKEKSLISTTSASPMNSSLVWAMGAGCYGYDPKTWDYSMSGFDNQILYGTKAYKTNFDDLSSTTYPYKVNINDGRTITYNGVTYKNYIYVENKATHVLYKYTPYTIDPALYDNNKAIGGGNYLFYQVFKGYWSSWT